MFLLWMAVLDPTLMLDVEMLRILVGAGAAAATLDPPQLDSGLHVAKSPKGQLQVSRSKGDGGRKAKGHVTTTNADMSGPLLRYIEARR